MNTNKPGYKHTSLGWIPEEWEVMEFGELFDFKNGINASKESYGQGVKFINVMEVIYNNSITANSIPGSVVITDKQLNDYSVSRGDVLFNRTSETTEEIGLTSVYLDDEPVVFGGFVIRGVPKNDLIQNDFKRYCFRSILVRQQIIKGGQGAVRSNIGQGDLEKVRIPLPSIPEQTSIANLLNTWEKAITTTTALIAQKEQRKKWLMQQLLRGKKRLKGFDGKVESHVLQQYITEVSDRNKNNAVSNVLSVTNTRGFINQADQFDRSVASEDSSNYKIVRKGQFAYNPSRVNVGSLDLLRTFDSGILSPMYVVFETDRSKLLPEFLYYHLKSYWFTRNIPMFVQGSVRDSLSFDGLSGMKFFIPSIQEQVAIVKILHVADEEIQILKQHMEQLKVQKKGLMQVLLTGRKRLKF